jgi:hypothetical protein
MKALWSKFNVTSQTLYRFTSRSPPASDFSRHVLPHKLPMDDFPSE